MTLPAREDRGIGANLSGKAANFLKFIFLLGSSSHEDQEFQTKISFQYDVVEQYQFIFLNRQP
jgi:hypothetical protein